jgi:hypothetical protein
MSDDSDNDSTCTPLYHYNEEEGLPEPEGQFGRFIQTNKSNEEQKQEVACMIAFINTNPSVDRLGALATTTVPTPLLIKAPGNNCKVQMIIGLAPVLADPFSTATSPLAGKLLALSQDINSADETPMPIHLPDDILQLKQIKVPMDTVSIVKLMANNDTGDGKKWFVEQNVTSKVNIPQAIPLPLFLA